MPYELKREQKDEQAFTVAQLNSAARRQLESLFSGIWLEAEVTESMAARSGHVYFTVSDPDGKAQLRAVMWRGAASRYGQRITVGAQLRLFGRLTVYEARGSYQFVADRLEEAGAGLRARRLEELKQKLAAEGLFAPERKRPLPEIPVCIGLVTSRDGAALRDILKVLGRRCPVKVVIAHAAVQGATAPSEIVAALGRIGMHKEVEMVIVGRGGGSADDLDAFNAEEVVRAVAALQVPVVSAVGHEVDFSLCDLAADQRAATPSEAAELAVPEIEALSEELDDYTKRVIGAAGRRVIECRARLAHLDAALHQRDPRMRLRSAIASLAHSRAALARWPGTALVAKQNRLSQQALRLSRWPAPALAAARRDFIALREPLVRWPEPALAAATGQLRTLAAELDALSPLAAFSRGYAMARRRPDGQLVRAASDAPKGSTLDLTLARGELVCEVIESKEES